ncbi:hypothetical protein V5799_009844 [Amblyomma americanum]|uniref:Secreted protein n=1 Tax=Amblyomma americanum TaxID=6943 RepID=A0AAQ4F987_AMBAM
MANVVILAFLLLLATSCLCHDDSNEIEGRGIGCIRIIPKEKSKIGGRVISCTYPCVGIPPQAAKERDGTPCWNSFWKGKCKNEIEQSASECKRIIPKERSMIGGRVITCLYPCLSIPPKAAKERDGTPCWNSLWKGKCKNGSCMQ